MGAEGPTKIVKYKESGSRYGIKFAIRHDYASHCVFSSGHLVDVTMSIIDIAQNETLLVIKQVGPDRECPPLTPVWELLAQELASAWK